MKLFSHLPPSRLLLSHLPSAQSFIKATALSTALLSSGFFGFSPQAAAAQDLPSLPLEFNPSRPLNPGRPGGRRRGGGSRGSCQASIPLTAIADAQSAQVQALGVTQVVETVGALTTQAAPMLWFYLPGAVGNIATEFVVKDSSDRVLYQGRLAGQTADSGVVGVPLAVDLGPGSAYHWFLTVDCDETERVTVDGWVERRAIGPDASRTLTQATGRNRVALYANYGFLQDALSELAQLRRENAEDEAIAQDWRQLMTALELPELADAMVLPCCEVTNALDELPSESPTEVPTEVPAEMPAEMPTEMPSEASPEGIDLEPEPSSERDDRSILERARDRGN